MKPLTIALIALCLPSVAHAQIAVSNSNSSSGSHASANSGSSSNSAASTGNAATTVTLNQPNTTNANTPADVTVRSAPQLYVPSVVTGNVCALGASAGASFIGTGFAVGASWESEQCENRQRAALLHNMGYKTAAKELACDNRQTYDAMEAVGRTLLDQARLEPRPVAGAQPAPIMPPPAPPPQQIAFNASQYASGSECLNAAMSAGAPLALCRGKP